MLRREILDIMGRKISITWREEFWIYQVEEFWIYWYKHSVHIGQRNSGYIVYKNFLFMREFPFVVFPLPFVHPCNFLGSEQRFVVFLFLRNFKDYVQILLQRFLQPHMCHLGPLKFAIFMGTSYFLPRRTCLLYWLWSKWILQVSREWQLF